MLFGNLDQPWVINEALKDNVNTYQLNVSNSSKKSGFSKLLQSLSHYGMSWDEDVAKNMQAIPADKNLIQKSDQLDMQGMFNTLGKWREKNNEDKNFFEKDLKDKIDILRKMSMQPELEDILDMMANESIVYDDDFTYICNPFIDTAVVQSLNEESAEEIRNAVDTIFYKMYSLANWQDKAWYDYKRFLIEGMLAYEIIYDDIKNPKNIIGILPIDPISLTRVIKDGITYWVQFKDVLNKERWLLDALVVYIKYEDSGCASRQSYLERLIRPFNIYRIVEQAQIIWTVTQASFKTIFTIPIQGMNRAKGMQTLNSAMARYKEDISFNIESGELAVNGKVNMPFNKEYWFPEGTAGSPKLETLVDNGPMIADNEQLKHFKADLYKMSKIPMNRFDSEAQTTWFGSDPTQTLRDEINFSRYVTRLRHEFAKILLKPIQIQLSLQIPGIKNDKRILEAIQLRFNTYNQFEEMMDMEVNSRRMEFIQTMHDGLTEPDAEGNDVPYFCAKFLVMKYLHMSDADLELNEKYKLEGKKPDSEEGEEGNEDEINGDDGGVDDFDGTESDGDSESSGGEAESDGGGDAEIDADMLGNVTPE